MKVSQKLYEAYRNNEPLSLGIIDVDNDGDAYRIQDEVLKKKESDGERLKGYKISLTSSATQEMFKSDAPYATKYEVISDGAVNGAIVYGEGRRVSHEDIDDIKGELSKDGELVQSGRSTEVLGHPVESVKWLIKELDQSGKRLLPRHVRIFRDIHSSGPARTR